MQSQVFRELELAGDVSFPRRRCLVDAPAWQPYQAATSPANIEQINSDKLPGLLPATGECRLDF